MGDAPTVLVTGGAGFVGSHVCRALAAEGYLPVAVDDLRAGHRDFVKWGPLVEATIDDVRAIDAAAAEHRAVACVHLAGSIEVGLSVKEPLRFWRNNVGATLTLIERLKANGVRAFIFSSTAAVYGAPDRVPMPEDHPERPDSPYGDTKLAIERLLESESRAGGLSWVAFRYFNAAGAVWRDGIGEDHAPETHLIPLACHAALGNRPPLTVFGNGYPTPDGAAVRDYVHVVDLARAHVLGLRAALAAPIGRAFNLGSGKGHSVREAIGAVAEQAGRPVPHEFGPRHAGDSPELVADPAAAAAILGWRAEHSVLDAIVADAWRWHSTRHAPSLAPLAPKR